MGSYYSTRIIVTNARGVLPSAANYEHKRKNLIFSTQSKDYTKTEVFLILISECPVMIISSNQFQNIIPVCPTTLGNHNRASQCTAFTAYILLCSYIDCTAKKKVPIYLFLVNRFIALFGRIHDCTWLTCLLVRWIHIHGCWRNSRAWSGHSIATGFLRKNLPVAQSRQSHPKVPITE